MPKTKLESVVFSAMMVFCMVFSMTCYTGALRAGGVTYGLFAQSIREMWIEFAFVFLLVFFGVSRIAPRIALKLLHPRELPQILFTLVVQGLTVSMVVPAVTLFASLLHELSIPFHTQKKPRHADVAFVFHDARLMTGMPFCRAMRTVCAVPLLPSGSPQKQTQQSASSTRRLFRRRIQSLV